MVRCVYAELSISMRRKLSKPAARSTIESTRPAQNSALMSRPRRLSGITLVVVLFQKLFRVDRGHATRARGGHGLAITVVLHIACHKHARNRGQAAMLGDQVAV